MIKNQKIILDNDEIELVKEMYGGLCSLRKISRDLKINRNVIRRTLSEAGVKIRDNYSSLKLTNQKHKKFPFSGDKNEAAYMVGLVKGDLTPIKKSKQTLRLSVGSTHKNFLEFLKLVFEKYGPVHIYPVKWKKYYQWNFSVDLDSNSFNFLFEAKKNNISEFDNGAFLHFLAGLIDTDGSVHIRKSGKYIQYLIRMFGQDKNLLEQINNRLCEMGFNPSLCRTAKKGEIRNHWKRDVKYNKDYYTLELARKDETFKFLNSLPLKYPEKTQRKKIMLDFIREGVIYHKDIRKMVELRNKIKNDVRDYVKEAEVEYKRRKGIN